MEIGKVQSLNETISEQDTFPERFSNSMRDQQRHSIFNVFNIQNRNCKTCIEIIKGVVTNPLIFMTVLGVFCGTFVFEGKGNTSTFTFDFYNVLFQLKKNLGMDRMMQSKYI